MICRNDRDAPTESRSSFQMEPVEMRTKFSVVTGDEFLHTVEIEVDGSAFSVRFGDDTRTILKVLDVCTFLKGF